MKKRKILWIAVPLIALIGVGVAGAGYQHYGGHHKIERLVNHVDDALQLNPEQQGKLEAVKDAFLESRKEIQQERQLVMKTLIDEVRKPELSQQWVMDFVDRRKLRLDELAPGLILPIIEFHKSLDREQREKIANLLEVFRDWGAKHQRHG